MTSNRLEAFSDGVLAIIITVMVLELKVPQGNDLAALLHTSGTGLLTYLLSFVYIGIYWNNHHHMFLLTDRISGGVLWANLHLLFWLSLYPFTTAWMDDSHLARVPVVVYGVNLLGAGVAYYVLQALIVRNEGGASALREAIGRDVKGRLSPILYGAGIAWALLLGEDSRAGVWIAVFFYVCVAVMWLVPDRRIERVIREGTVSSP
ncbi:MAG: TMEM175 family protein [Nocardioidaceae bacterium]